MSQTQSHLIVSLFAAQFRAEWGQARSKLNGSMFTCVYVNTKGKLECWMILACCGAAVEATRA